MNIKEIVRKLEGVQTIGSVMSILNIDKKKAIYIVYKLRKEGYLKTRRMPSKKRVYYISFENKQGGTSYYEIINNYSRIKVSTPETYKIYGREVTLEETLIFAIKSKKLRIILASLSLFRIICNWSLLYKLAKINKVERKVGALHDLSKKAMRVRRIDGRFKRLMIPKSEDNYQYIIEGLRSKDFKEIENYWKVYIPFNKKDLEGI